MTESRLPGNAPRVAALLRDRKEILIQTWIERVLTDPKVPEANKLSTPDLVDHIPLLIEQIIASLSGCERRGASTQPPPPSEVAGRRQGDSKAAREHAEHRFTERYSTAEAMRELSHFRAALMDLCRAEEVPLDGEAAKHVHALIDEGMSTLATGMERAAHAELRRDAMFRERFMGILGHDLRNPLGTVTMAATMLLEWEDLPPVMVKPVRRILSSAGRMARLIRDLLDLTRSRVGGGLPIAPMPADLHAICRQTVDELELQHPTSPLLLTAEGNTAGSWDPDRLAQVVSNLVGNALTHGLAGAPVRVALREEADSVVLEVHNEGPPIPPELQAILFDPFRRGPQAASREASSDGLGLGLFISRQIVEAHGGSLEVTSEPGLGTAFTVRLPKEAPSGGELPR